MKCVASIVLLTLIHLGIWAQDCMPAKPNLQTQDNTLVYDFANFIDDEAETRLNTKLVKFYRESSNQILVVVADDLCGYEAWEYATRLGQDWGLGTKDKDNGVVLLLQPKRQGQRGNIFIATGKGLEGAIPDVYANRITDNVMIPLFKQDQYTQGLEEGTDLVIDLAKGEYNDRVAMIQGGSSEGDASIYLFLLVMLAILAISMFSYHSRVVNYADVNKLAYWAAFWLLMNQHGHSGRLDGYGRSNRSGGFGGGFGGGGGVGGFGGFGGGGFGGGGAGGSW